MNRFESGSKRDYYGKGDVIVYRLAREAAGSTHGSPVFGASVLMGFAVRRRSYREP